MTFGRAAEDWCVSKSLQPPPIVFQAPSRSRTVALPVPPTKETSSHMGPVISDNLLPPAP